MDYDENDLEANIGNNSSSSSSSSSKLSAKRKPYLVKTFGPKPSVAIVSKGVKDTAAEAASALVDAKRVIGSSDFNAGEFVTQIGMTDRTNVIDALTNIQSTLNNTIGALVVKETELKSILDDTGAADFAERKAQAEAERAELKRQIESLLAVSTEILVDLAQNRKIAMPVIVQETNKMMKAVQKSREKKTSLDTRTIGFWNTKVNPKITEFIEELPELKDVAVMSLATGAGAGATLYGLLQTGLTTPAAVEGLAQSLLFAAPLENSAFLSGVCGIVTSPITTGISTACLIYLLSNPVTRNQIMDFFRGTRNNFNRLVTKAQDAVLKMSNAVEQTIMETGAFDFGQGSDYNTDLAEVQSILAANPAAAAGINALNDPNNPCNGGRCDPNKMTETQRNMIAAVVRQGATPAVSRAPTPNGTPSFGESRTGISAGLNTINNPQGEANLMSALTSVAREQLDPNDIAQVASVVPGGGGQDPREIAIQALIENNGNVDNAIAGIMRALSNAAGTDVGGRRKTKQRKTKQRKTKRQVKRRSQTKKGKKRTQTKNVVRRMSLQSQMKKQKMSSQQMQKLMMQQQMMKYNAKMY